MEQAAVIDFLRGRTDESRALLVQVLEARTRVQEENHPETLRAADRLVTFYTLTRDYAEALPLSLRTVEIAHKTLGDRHPITLRLRSELGMLYVAMDRDTEACAEYEIVVRQRRQIDETLNRPATWFAIKSLGACYERLDRQAEALPLYRDLLANLPTTTDDPDAPPIALSTAAWVLTREIDEFQNPPRALELAQRAIDVAQAKKNALNNPWLHLMLDTLATAQHQVGDTAAAIETQRQSLARLSPRGLLMVGPAYETRLRTYEAARALEIEAEGANDEQ